MTWVQSDDLGIALGGALAVHTIGALVPQARSLIAEHPRSALRADLRQVEHLDTAGAVFLRGLPDLARSLDKELRLDGLPAHLQPVFDFATPAPPSRPHLRRLALPLNASALGSALMGRARGRFSLPDGRPDLFLG